MAAIRVGTLADERIQTGPLPDRRALLERAVAAGLDHTFVADHVSFHDGFGMDGLVQAATVAATEARLGVAVGVYLLALRHPVPVARQLASLCASAPGRLVLGVGVGGEDRHEIEICGVDPATRGRRTDACLAALRDLLRGEPASADNEFFSFSRAWIRPAPDPPLRIVIGGRSDAALRRTARFGEGWLAAWCSPRRFAESVATVEDAARDAGRRDVSWRHGLQLWVGLDEDRARARERVAHAMREMYALPFEPFERYTPYGGVDEVADALAPYVEAGCLDFNVMGVGESTERVIDDTAAIKERLLGAARAPARYSP